MKTESYHIDGMACAACSSAVERVTRKMDGVQSSDVNLTTNKMVITYDEGKVTESMIVEKVAKAGFQASKIEETGDRKKQEEKELEKQEEQLHETRRRVITAICFAVPLLYISMGHMMGMPLPDIISPASHGINFALVQLLLTVVVLICGRKFYVVGLKALVKGNPNMDSLVAIGTGSAFIYSLCMTWLIPSGRSFQNA